MSSETWDAATWHIADEDGNPVCGAEDADAFTLSDPENIADAEQHGRICRECEP